MIFRETELTPALIPALLASQGHHESGAQIGTHASGIVAPQAAGSLGTVLQIYRPYGAAKRRAARGEWKLAGVGMCPRQARRGSSQRRTAIQSLLTSAPTNREDRILLEGGGKVRQVECARAHGMWTYESRQGRNAATAVCSASAVVTLALFKFSICDF